MSVDEIIYTFEPSPYDKDLATTRTLRFANVGFVTKPGDTPANTPYRERLLQPINIKRSIVAPGRTSGASRVAYGDVTLKNLDGALDDDFMNLAFDGRAAVIRRGIKGGDMPGDFPAFLVPAMSHVEVGNKVTVKLTDHRYDLSGALQPNRFAGTNVLPDGLEGTAGDLKGKVKPLLFGRVHSGTRRGNVAPPLVNTARLIHQWNDGAIAGFAGVYDAGVELTAETAYTTLAQLLDDSLAPSAGCYKAYLAGGYTRLGSSPSGTITGDPYQGANEAARTSAQGWLWAIGRAGFVGGDWSASDITAADAAWPAVCGIYVDYETPCGPIADLFAASADAWYSPDKDGVLRFKQLPLHLDPADSVARFTANDLLNKDTFERQSTTDEGHGLPVYSVVGKYARNYHLQEGAPGVDVAALLSAPTVSFAIDDTDGGSGTTFTIVGAANILSLKYYVVDDTVAPTAATVRASGTLVNASRAVVGTGLSAVGAEKQVAVFGYTELSAGGDETPLGTWSVVRPLGSASAGSGAALDVINAARYRCKVLASGTTVPTATSTDIVYDSEAFDVGGMHDNGVNPPRLTIPASNYTGRWLFLARVVINAGAAAGAYIIDVVKNGATSISQIAISLGSSETIALQIAALDTDPAASDYYTVNVVQTSGVNATVGGDFTAAHL